MSVAADGLPPLRDVIRDYGLNAKKSLGQNFILDLNLTRRIARCCGPLDGRTVVEVGPGPGGLTRALLAEGAGHVVAIERDDRCLAALADVASHWPGRLHLSHGDALEADFARLVAPYGGTGDPKPLIIANLPYGIATKLLVGWLTLAEWPPWYGGMALMFQKEVAERIVAPPGGKSYGRLAVLAQWRAEASISLTLPPQAFVPPPKVSSAVVVVTPRQHAEPECRVQTLARLTAAAFGQRRKMLRASLKQLLPDPDTLLAEAGIDPAWRGEQIDVAGFARLAALIDARGGHDVGRV